MIPFTRRGENVPLSKTFPCNKTLIFPCPLCDCVFLFILRPAGNRENGKKNPPTTEDITSEALALGGRLAFQLIGTAGCSHRSTYWMLMGTAALRIHSHSRLRVCVSVCVCDWRPLFNIFVQHFYFPCRHLRIIKMCVSVCLLFHLCYHGLQLNICHTKCVSLCARVCVRVCVRACHRV